MYYIYHQTENNPFEYYLWSKTGYESFTYAADAWYAWLDEKEWKVKNKEEMAILYFPGNFIPPNFLSKKKS